MSVSYLLKYIFYVFIIFCLVSHRFPVGIRVLNWGGGGGGTWTPPPPPPPPPVLVPNSRAFFMTIPHAEHPSSLILKPFSFPIPLLVPRFLANPASRVTVNSRIPSINFAFSRIPHPGSNPGYRETSFRLYRISLASIFVVFMRMTRPVP